MRSLYLSIYGAVLAVLLAFTGLAVVLVHLHADSEEDRVEAAVGQRLSAWAELLEHSLPPADAPEAVQAESLRHWSVRLRLAIALDDPTGRRLANTPLFDQALAAREDSRRPPVRVDLSDGRAIWLISLSPLLQQRMVAAEGLPVSHMARQRVATADLLNATPQESPVSVLVDWLLPDSVEEVLDENGRLIVLLVLVSFIVAGASLPVVRRVTRRLEALKHGVDAFGEGRLEHRVEVQGSDEVAALAHSFNQAAGRIDDLVRANRSLLANASHEFRSPLARMKMALAMLDTTPEPQRQHMRAEIERDIRELDALVEEVLMASRLDARASIVLDRMDLLGIAADEAARVGAEVAIAPEAAGRAEIHGDERLVRRALRNLLENARRYGGAEVELHLAPLPAGAWRIEVLDRGTGVPEAERQRVFEPFYRMPGHSEHSGGVGLGLALVRQIALRHGGEVGCSPRDGGGTCFHLVLPAQAPEDVARALPPGGALPALPRQRRKAA
jgi:signal transduction histidine kinase